MRYERSLSATGEAPSRVRAGPPSPADRSRTLPWHLRLYVVVLALMMLHAIGLMIAATITTANPSLVRGTRVPPWSHVTFYLVTNFILVVYTGYLMALIVKRRRSAILHNGVVCVLTITLHVAWHALGMKSTIGMVADSMPIVLGVVYFTMSVSVRQALVEHGERVATHT